jgi:hypothetical protein
VNDLVIHPRDNALVLATHGRGLWVLDDLRPYRGIGTVAMAAPVTLASAAPVVYQKRLQGRLSHTGDVHFRGENPANGATFTVWAKDSGAAVSVVVKSAAGVEQWKQSITARRGPNTTMWNLRGPSLPPIPALVGAEVGEGEDAKRPIPGAFVRPGSYTVTAESGGAVVGRGSFEVRADRRQDASPAARAAWHTTLDSIATLYSATVALRQRTGTVNGERERADTIAELQARIGALYQALEPQVGPPTADMRAQLASYAALYARLERGVGKP